MISKEVLFNVSVITIFKYFSFAERYWNFYECAEIPHMPSCSTWSISMSTFFRCPHGLGALCALCAPCLTWPTCLSCFMCPCTFSVFLHYLLLAIRVLRGLVFVVLLTLMPAVFGFVLFPSGFIIFSHLINF